MTLSPDKSDVRTIFRMYESKFQVEFRDEAIDGVAKNSRPLMSFQWFPLYCSIDIEWF